MGAYELMQKLEKMRKEYCMNIIIPVCVMAVCFLLGATLPTKTYGSFGKLLCFFIGFILGTALCVWGDYKNKSLKKKYRDFYKQTFVKKILEEYLEEVDYSDWHNGLSQLDVMKTGLIKIGEVFSSEDLMRGVYKEVSFKQSDVTSIHYVGEGKNRELDYRFSGRVMEFNMGGKKAFTVKAISTDFPTYMEQIKDKIELENVEFNSKFRVFSVDEHDAFFVMTPQVMEKLLTLQRKYGNIGVKFTQDALYVAISGTDTFDTPFSITKKMVWYEEKEKTKKTAEAIMDIIDMLKLVDTA